MPSTPPEKTTPLASSVRLRPARGPPVPTASIRKFLDGAGVYPVTGKSDIAAAKEAVVRVICVRK